MKGIDLFKGTYVRGHILYIAIFKILNISKRVFNKLNIEELRNKTERLEIRFQILKASNDNIVAMVGDKCHKLLQQAIGQQIVSNEFYVRKLLQEVNKREIDSPIVRWGQNIYDDYIAGNLYKHIEVEDDHLNNKTIDLDRLNDFIEITRSRQSIRKYLPDKIDIEAINKIISCGIEAPSSCNRQSWRFLTITEKPDKEYLAKIRNVKFIAEAPLVICVMVNMEFYTSNAQGDKRITPIMDACAAMMNILNACTASGLGSCWVNFIASVGIENINAFKKKFNIPNKYVPISLITTGYHKYKIKKPSRNNINHYWINSKL